MKIHPYHKYVGIKFINNTIPVSAICTIVKFVDGKYLITWEEMSGDGNYYRPEEIHQKFRNMEWSII